MRAPFGPTQNPSKISQPLKSCYTITRNFPGRNVTRTNSHLIKNSEKRLFSDTSNVQTPTLVTPHTKVHTSPPTFNDNSRISYHSQNDNHSLPHNQYHSLQFLPDVTISHQNLNSNDNHPLNFFTSITTNC